MATGLAPTYAALLAGLHFTAEASLGGYALEVICKEFDMRRDKLKTVTITREEEALAKEASTLLLLLSHLYNQGVAHCGLAYDVIKELLENVTNRDMELLLLLLRTSGMQLRSDDPSSLKDIVLLAHVRSFT